MAKRQRNTDATAESPLDTLATNVGALDFVTVERRIDKLSHQLHAVRAIIGTVSDTIECMISARGRTNGTPHDPIFALIAARDLLNEMEEGLDVNELLAPTATAEVPS